jgi:hypothetical protein
MSTMLSRSPPNSTWATLVYSVIPHVASFRGVHRLWKREAWPLVYRSGAKVPNQQGLTFTWAWHCRSISRSSQGKPTHSLLEMCRMKLSSMSLIIHLNFERTTLLANRRTLMGPLSRMKDLVVQPFCILDDTVLDMDEALRGLEA